MYLKIFVYSVSVCYAMIILCHSEFTDESWAAFVKYAGFEIVVNLTNITYKSLIPELHLFLRDDKSELFPKAVTIHPAYWRTYYPGAQALSRYILDNSHIVRNKSVLEIGCGCGAVSIAAAKSGASDVTANTIDPIAIVATRLNAILNNVSLRWDSKNLVGTNVPQDIIIFGEQFEYTYDEFEWSVELHKAGKIILFGDYCKNGWLRWFRNQENFTKITEYQITDYFNCVSRFMFNIDGSCGSVFTF